MPYQIDLEDRGQDLIRLTVNETHSLIRQQDPPRLGRSLGFALRTPAGYFISV